MRNAKRVLFIERNVRNEKLGIMYLAASLKAAECGLDYLTIDQDDTGGTIRKYPRCKLVMTQPVALPLGEKLKPSQETFE